MATITKQIKIDTQELSETIKASVEINGLSNASKRIAKHVSDMVSLAYRDCEVQFKLHNDFLCSVTNKKQEYIIIQRRDDQDIYYEGLVDEDLAAIFNEKDEDTKVFDSIELAYMELVKLAESKHYVKDLKVIKR
jgi:hypothetical protein